MGITFLVSDESVNSAGFRILTSGIDFTDFLKNPVMLWKHERYDNRLLPIGRWENLRIENGALLADAIFDEKDEFARQIATKVEKGIINACSIGIEVIATSSESKYLLQGQTRETVTRCILLEISLVDLPGNRNSVKLYNAGSKSVNPSHQELMNIPFLKLHIMDTLKTKLGLQITATEAEVEKHVEQLVSQHHELQEEVKTLKQKLSDLTRQRAEELVNEAISSARITASQKEKMMNMALADFEGTKELLNLLQPAVKPSEQIRRKTAGSAELKTWKDLIALGRAEVARVKKEDPQLYRTLYKEEFKHEPDLNLD
ncbi:MAG: phage protease [Bacteroidales bacterium]